MTADDLFNQIISENAIKSRAVAALNLFAAQANKALYKDKLAEEFNGLTRENAREILRETAKKLENEEPLFITLAVELPEEKLLDLGTRIRKLFGKKILFEPAVDSSLLAGARLVWKGRMLDLSLKTRLETSRPLILEICQKYLS
jgi:F0F1-type ATP synthase delta subunit